MTTSLYLASAESRSGKSAVAVGVLDQLVRHGVRVGVFRPIVRSGMADPMISLLLPRSGADRLPRESIGVTYERMHADQAAAVGEVVDRYHRFAEGLDVVLVVGSDFTDVPGPTEFAVNATIAANIGAPMMLVVPAGDRPVAETITAADLSAAEARAHHAHVLAVIANRADPQDVAALSEDLRQRFGGEGSCAIPADPVLAAPTLRDIKEACQGRMILGAEDQLDREVAEIVVAGMTLPHVLDRLVEDAVLICPSDREEILLGALLAHRSSTFPSISGLVLNGGFPISAQVRRLIDGMNVTLPVITVDGGTFDTATACHGARGRITTRTVAKLEAAIRAVDAHLDVPALLPHLAPVAGHAVTPLMFEHRITEWAREADAHIVLPEGMEERILRASEIVLARGIARLTLVGDEEQVRARARSIGARIDGVQIVDPAESPLRVSFAQLYTDLRAHKGMTLAAANDIVIDPSYFGTLMVKAGQADGMVSGSITTTAATVRPALEIIRTVPGVSVVSSVFFMCLADRVLVYGDCAINPTPNPEQLADIAISSSQTARQFGVEPRVAMLSYSTGGSGVGADVEAVRAATEIVRSREPDLLIEGPIQYDAAVDPAVAATKLKGSPVAGQATVLIFPDLNTGNNTYKAVQRSASAVAVGPVLQGLRAPVNDLSRGATVADIVNTIAITATQVGRSR